MSRAADAAGENPQPLVHQVQEVLPSHNVDSDFYAIVRHRRLLRRCVSYDVEPIENILEEERSVCSDVRNDGTLSEKMCDHSIPPGGTRLLSRDGMWQQGELEELLVEEQEQLMQNARLSPHDICTGYTYEFLESTCCRNQDFVCLELHNELEESQGTFGTEFTASPATASEATLAAADVPTPTSSTTRSFAGHLSSASAKNPCRRKSANPPEEMQLHGTIGSVVVEAPVPTRSGATDTAAGDDNHSIQDCEPTEYHEYINSGGKKRSAANRIDKFRAELFSKVEPVTSEELFRCLRRIQDPEHPLSLEQLDVLLPNNIIVHQLSETLLPLMRSQLQRQRSHLMQVQRHCRTQCDALQLDSRHVQQCDRMEFQEQASMRIEVILSPRQHWNALPRFIVDVAFKPTIPHCSQATLIGLLILLKLMRVCASRSTSVKILPGTHLSANSINKQLADKERVHASTENPALKRIVYQGLRGSDIWSSIHMQLQAWE